MLRMDDGGRARMAFSETGVARSYLDDGGMCVRLFAFNVFVLGFWWCAHSGSTSLVNI